MRGRLSFLGDLVATGFSEDSHNRRFGRKLGEGSTPAEAEHEMRLLPEGARAVGVACEWGEARELALPLAQFVRQLAGGARPPLKVLLQHLC
jgi:glycerol-3-phosphate dehydrogenase